MGVTLRDLGSKGDWSAHYPDWRCIVENIIRLELLPIKVAKMLHHELVDSGLTRQQALLVADGLRKQVLPTLGPNDRLLFNGWVLDEYGHIFWDPPETKSDWITTPTVLAEFIAFCEACDGFVI